jgi:uncharacterized protein
MSRLAAWFDIPVDDMERAVRFYETVTGMKLERMDVPGGKETATFGSEGCLFKAPEDRPSHFGSRVYFSAQPSIEAWVERIEAAGGKVLVPKTPIGQGMGHFAYFEDSEGNRVGLHARP